MPTTNQARHRRELTSNIDMPVSRTILDQIKRLIPPLDGTLHKGQSGRVGVLGGALDYTGAPYFAAISALRFGADLSHVICSPTAAGAIKSYSPDLIVHPILNEASSSEDVKPELKSILSRLHVLIVGPGLGREPYMQTFAKMAVSIAREQGMFIVLDADGLYMIGKDRSVIQGYRRAVVTPNVVEFKRLSEQVGIDPDTPSDKRSALVSRKLGGVTVLQKGPQDMISTDSTGEEADLPSSQLKDADAQFEQAKETVFVDIEGGLKRCGGQGDVLSGTVGTFMAWGKCYEDGAFGLPTSRIPLLAAVGGSMVTRTASRIAFAKNGRSLVTEDMLPEIGKAFSQVFDEKKTEGKL
ncbi:ATP-dependent (S)-NAD(P)H-hydrate dehydratase [Psilocybe cubensis]|uniref:ATP-dependent (S)-NAD(P)H-hydrate dehydratase n=2 Tax=Psilocybe cubensis TaxID=181762 RepID=A0ACB8GUJ8_PSICU|nr:ATP-dependent (S)-NAD(P)H-hydrate dehydratase [Psilocybe cubensis]KAH9479410.1 ATP-dependent (S)-NAD(P)H-hydrate dehydratase [Psilocybe cubensis]